MDDLEPAERRVHALLAAVPPAAPPFGFRDRVMRGVRGKRARTELVLAAAIAIPSLAFAALDVAPHADQVLGALDTAVAAAQGAQTQLVVVVDGVLVLASALIGLAGLLAADALLRPGSA